MLPTPPDDETDLPEARGSHLPEAFGRMPVAAWFLVALAVGRLAWSLRDASVGGVLDPWRLGQVVLFGAPSVVAILIPAALLTRHRDARSQAPWLLAGAILLAAVEGLRVLSSPLEPFLEGLTPADPAVPFAAPASLAYQAMVGLLHAVALAAIGGGLVLARRHGDRSATWPAVASLATLVVVVAVTGVVSVSRLPYDQLELTPVVEVDLVATVVLNVVTAMAVGFVAATATAGARAEEDPARGWRVAAIGAWLVIGGLGALGIAGIASPTPDVADLVNGAIQVIEAVLSLGFLGLLAGFVLGLPALAPVSSAARTQPLDRAGSGAEDAHDADEAADASEAAPGDP